MIKNICLWLADTSLSHTFRDIFWLVPLVQTVHILSISIVLTAAGTLAFRLKMLLVIALVVVLRTLHSKRRIDNGQLESSASVLRAPRALGLVTLVLTVSMVIAGRLIAYT